MAPSIPFAMILLLAILPLILLGAAMLRRGWLPRRVGDEPHCQPCGYLLVGLQSERCPECGVLLSPANILYGQRHRPSGMALAGTAILLLGLSSFSFLATKLVTKIPWYHFKPTFLVMRDLRAGGGSAGIAMQELDRREQAARLPSKYQQQLIEMGLAQQATTASGALPQAMIEFVEQQYLTGHLSDAQKKRFGQQSMAVTLRVRPFVVLGDRVPYEIDYFSRVYGHQFAAYPIGGSQIEIDGIKTRELGSNEISSWDSTESCSYVECQSPGKDQLSVTIKIELRHAGSFLYEEVHTLTADFEVVAQAPRGNLKLISDAALAGRIQASIVPAGLNLSFRKPALGAVLEIVGPPADIAFEAYARIDSREYSMNTFSAKKDGRIRYFMRCAVPGVATTRPTFDLILRTSEKAARETVDEHEIWSGELIYPNLPVR